MCLYTQFLLVDRLVEAVSFSSAKNPTMLLQRRIYIRGMPLLSCCVSCQDIEAVPRESIRRVPP